MGKKVLYLEKKVSVVFSLRRKIMIAFQAKIDRLNINKNDLMEELMLEWMLNIYKNEKQDKSKGN